MTKPLKVLIVEDNERDAAMLLRELRRGGYEPEAERVETPEAMHAALDKQAWQLIVSDYSMPRFNAPAALALARGRDLDIPFIIVSGTVGEEIAVEAMRAGANDFMPKDALARLLPAIDRELREAAVRAERKQVREQLLISDRMASVGTLSASIAHDINTPLTVISANLEFVAQQLAALEDSAKPGNDLAGRLGAMLGQTLEPLRDAQEAAERVRAIVHDLKVFSRSTEEERRRPVDIQHVLESAARMASNEVRHRANLVRDYANPPPVDGHEARLGQVFLNLIVNAAQAIPEGRAAANEIRLTTRSNDAGLVVVEVRDTGIGIAPDLVSRIFDPFFTTKAQTTGTGLGLAICHRIVKSLGGDISVESELGRGTTFRVSLPRAVNEPSEAEAPQPEIQPKHKGRVLVVDDERMLCATIERVLFNEHEVVTTTSAKEAVRRIVQGERFDIILSDLMMPEMTGMDFHRELSRVAPEQAVKMIFMTGGAFSADAADFLQRVPNPSIEKPFKPKALRDLLQSLIQ